MTGASDRSVRQAIRVAREGSREERRRPRLDQPQDSKRGLGLPSYNPESMGRISERVARFLGTWRFIGYMTLFIVVWLAINWVGPTSWQFDPARSHFTGLTLILSLQASYAAPLILLAQNRQTDRDRVQFDQDRALSERTVADTEYLARELAAVRVALGDVATRDFLRGELRDLLEELDDRSPRGKGKKSGKDKHHETESEPEHLLD
jgi:uncharacterized membrane protein